MLGVPRSGAGQVTVTIKTPGRKGWKGRRGQGCHTTAFAKLGIFFYVRLP